MTIAERIRILGDPACPTRIVENPEDIDNPILAFFLSLWRSDREGCALPLRSSFVPQKIRGNLRWVVLADALPNYDDFRFRVVGTNVSQYFLSDGTGKTLREVFTGQDQIVAAGTLWVYQRACLKRTPIRVTGPDNTFKGVFFPNFDAAYLPYSSDGLRADHIVNVFTFNYRKFRDVKSRRSFPTAD